MAQNEKLKVYTLDQMNHLKINGRHSTIQDKLPLFWTGSGIEFSFRGSELWVEVEVDFDEYEPWISILVNEQVVARQMLLKGRYWLCVVRGMATDTLKHIQIIRDTQAMSDDPQSHLCICKIKCDGTFEKVEEKSCKIEFIGDSITSGEGAIGAKEEEDWLSMWFSVLRSYPYMTAKALHADYQIVSQSGWGVLTSWDNNPNQCIPQYYEMVCGLLKGEDNLKLGALAPYDFKSWQPNVVVINLGTNDESAFHSPAWQDPLSGESYKQRLNADGTYHKEDLARFETAVYAFAKKVRKHRPLAQIIWCYGMLGYGLMPAIYKSINQYIEDTGDQKISILQLPNTTEQTVGARCHPGILAHQRAAELLSEYIKTLLIKKEN